MNLSSIKKLKVIVKAGKNETKIVSYDSLKNVLVVEISAIAKDNKANIELIKFLTKFSKRKVCIKSGFTSKNKIIEFD